MFRFFAPLGAMLVFTPSAGAQDLEYRDVHVEESEGPLSVNGGFESAWYEYNNLDFRPLDESSDQAILDSDDRGGFPFTGAWLDLAYQVEPGIRFVMGASHRGLWGGDQLGNVNSYGGFLYMTALYVDLTPDAESGFTMRVGRQQYSLGGLAGGPDYVLLDTLDMIRADIPIGIGTLEVIPVNVIEQTDNDGLDLVSYIGRADVATFNFRGDTIMRRHGATARLDELPGPIDALLYGFYTDIGAGVSAPSFGLFSSGTDISYQGLLGNFTDNDWVANYGVRVSSDDLGVIKPYAHFDLSSGIDRKELVARDVDANGYAYGLGVHVETGEEDGGGLRAGASYFDALGPAFAKDGLQFSHGYVGMKGSHVGGTLFGRFMGFHPSAYVSLFGVTDTPHEYSRRSGTRAMHANAGYELDNGPRVKLSWWMLQDTGVSNVNFKQLDTITPPFGYARDEFAAQERHGTSIGQELNLDFGWAVTEHLDTRLGGAIILPGAYYAIETARVAGAALGSSDPAMPWGLNAGMKVVF